MTLSRNVIKKTLGFSIGCIPQLQRALKRGLSVFVFHEVSDHPSRFAEQFGLAVSIETFSRQIHWIKSNFNVMRPADLLNEKRIPKYAAIVSFDDGFLGSFENGLPILERMEVPSVLFLNMQAILEKKPLLSATACYLNRYIPEFSDFSKATGLSPPFHLTLSPSILKAFESYYGAINQDAVLDYQGPFADLNVVKKWDGKDLVFFGNHLFDHWNATALSLEEFEEQYTKNEVALTQLKNRVNLFAFTNGQPETCFSNRDIACLNQLGAGKAFSASGGINRDPDDNYLLERMSLTEGDGDEDRLWFRMLRAGLK